MSNQIGTLDSFSGTFNISDHSLISQVLQEYLFEYFYDRIESKWIGKGCTLSNISLDEINQELNRVWEGPGSVEKLRNFTKSSRELRLGNIVDDSALKGYKTPTVDDTLEQEDL